MTQEKRAQITGITGQEWKPRVGFRELIKKMVDADLREAEKEQLCRTA